MFTYWARSELVKSFMWSGGYLKIGDGGLGGYLKIGDGGFREKRKIKKSSDFQ